MSDKQVLTIGHSPDADDAFMFYAMTHGKIDCGNYQFRHQLEDIQTLNERALRGELEISAVSLHAYAHCADQYALLHCGASMGKGYGPIVVTRTRVLRDDIVADLRTKRIAVPGTMTTAFLVLRLFLGEFDYLVVPFDRIFDAVKSRQAAAGLVIHEGQITYLQEGLHLAADLGNWWLGETGLPLPLGVNVVRRNLGAAALPEIARIMRDSIAWGLDHQEEALDYALQYGRGMDRSTGSKFVNMYVNHYTRDFGAEGERAVTELLTRAHAAGALATLPAIEFVR